MICFTLIRLMYFISYTCLTFLIIDVLIDNSSTGHLTFEGYEYFKDQYCQTPTYDNNATTIEEAVARCSSDSKCVAIEDRWGTGLPPLGLCAKFKGKRSGAQSMLLKKGYLLIDENRQISCKIFITNIVINSFIDLFFFL